MGDTRERVAVLVALELVVVCLLGEEVVDEVATALLVRTLERERTVETAGTKQCRVEEVSAVGRGDYEDVRTWRDPLGQLAVGRQKQVDGLDNLAVQLLHPGG